MKQQQVRSERLIAEKKEREAAKEKVQEKVATEMQRRDRERAELEEIRYSPLSCKSIYSVPFNLLKLSARHP